jgi:putative Mg2+ transporter-C (MgtC) family protein
MAGLKTNALVSTGAAGFVCFATVAAGGNPSQVAAQIVSGIGFLGAGVIMREGINVHGLNTAATLWCSAMVGALCGYGLWQDAGVAASLILGTNILLRPVANWLNLRVQSGSEVESRYTITLTCESGAAPRIRAALQTALRQHHLPAQQWNSEPGGGENLTTITVQSTTPHAVDSTVETVLAQVTQEAAVCQSSWKVARADPEA